jgi:hypothetical protein
MAQTITNANQYPQVGYFLWREDTEKNILNLKTT